MNDQELRTSNYNYDAATLLQRVRDLFARDAELLGSAIQRSALMRVAGTDPQHVITRIDVLPKSIATNSAEILDYGSVMFVSEILDRENLLSRLSRLSEKCFQAGEHLVRSTAMGFSDRYEASRSTYSDWPSRIFDISFGSVQLPYEPLLHSRLKAFSSSYDAVREFLKFDSFNGSSDGRLGHIQMCIPNLNARLERLDLTGGRLTVNIDGAARHESLKLSLNCKNEQESKAVERILDEGATIFELPFSPIELQLWLISVEGYLADFHDENLHRSDGANPILPKPKQRIQYDFDGFSGADVLSTVPSAASPSQVFIIHGHNVSVKESVARFLEKLGLEAIILHEQPNRGSTIIEKFERHAGVSFAIALVTGDDEAREVGSTAEPKKRPRQNVIFEFGFFVGKLGRAHVCALLEEGVEIPSDYQGVVYIPLDSAERWKFDLVRELKFAGFEVDANRAI
jgi:Predicted nucleotide-binding protein containing TIR-like domain